MPRSSITMKDVAKAAGVSVMTVSRAFRDDKSIGSETRAKVLQSADALGYVLDATASNLRLQRTNFVAVIIPSINNANFAETVGALSDALEPTGMQVLLGHSNYDTTKEEQLIEQLLRRRPDAIVVTGGQHSPRGRKLLENAGIPVIETWDLPTNPVAHVVGFSNAQTMHEMVGHLVGRGHKRIAFVGGETDTDTRGAARRRGFIAAMTQHGLAADRLVHAGPTPISMREGAAAMGRLLETLPDTQAVIGVSDLSAFGALTECQRRGLQVPGDIAIAGFGAYEISAVSHPTLTTIDPNPSAIGTAVAELITALRDSGSAMPRQRIVMPWSLRVGGST